MVCRGAGAVRFGRHPVKCQRSTGGEHHRGHAWLGRNFRVSTAIDRCFMANELHRDVDLPSVRLT